MWQVGILILSILKVKLASLLFTPGPTVRWMDSSHLYPAVADPEGWVFLVEAAVFTLNLN